MTRPHDHRLDALVASGDWRLLDTPLSFSRALALAWVLWRHPYHVRVVVRERFLQRQVTRP